MSLDSGFQWMTMDYVAFATAAGRVVGGTYFNDVSASITHSIGGMVPDSGIFNASYFPSTYNLPTSGIFIRNNLMGVFTATFSKSITNALVLFSSVGSPYSTVRVDISQPFTPVWVYDPARLWFDGATNETQYTEVHGREGYCIIRIDGTMNQVSFDYTKSEAYCNIMFGFVNQNDPAINQSFIQSISCSPIFDKFAHGTEDGCNRFRRLRLHGYL